MKNILIFATIAAVGIVIAYYLVIDKNIDPDTDAV
jgi:hypothetical protein